MASAERGTQKRRSNFEELSEELQIEILCRVIPYKHLVRCKCVSKRWLSLISSYRFHSWTHMYMNKIRLKPAYVHSDSVVQDSRFKSKGFTLTFLPCHQPKKPIYVYNTLDGLFLCSATSNPHLPQNIYYVCNPLTMDWVALPSPPHRSYLRPYMLLVTVKLIHDGDDYERYQVVRVYRRRSDSGVLMVDIFSFEAKQWICRDVTLSVSRLCKWTSDIEINNGILYAAWSKAGTKMVVVVNLNSNDHHHHIIQLPKLGQPLSHYGGFRIVECRRRGGLRAVDVAFAEGTTSPALYIWELKENYKGKEDDAWSLMHCLPFTEMIAVTNKERLSEFSKWFSDIANGRLPLHSHDVTIHYFDPVDGNLVYLSLHKRFFSYDICNKTLTSHPRMKYSTYEMWKPLFQTVLPLRPTPVPSYKL